MMPLYDCGSPDCEECQQAFGPNRAKAIARFKAREAACAVPYASTADGLAPRRQAAGGGGREAEKVRELATPFPGGRS